ncbi:threonine ammonia-lyase [Dyella subtropica]|uniref:threonine ammonia-lyase n=1 Tax=Dyella subtropica TaxID=2992127 RepID=UPI0022569DDB|nr:pyridoxal-phosphate dependent enzyme [Dyella subtropica]
MLDIANIQAATRLIDPVFLKSPLASAAALDAELGCMLLAKNETANPIGSFKGRGAELFAATALRPGETIVCASAGNFGQGLAHAAARRGHACTVFAATTANPVKIDAMRRLGAEVRLEGIDFDAAKQAARRYAAEHDLRFVEDGAEPAIAEGAGTMALELLGVADFDAVVVPLGNGALLEGIGAVFRQRAPATEIIAVVAENAPAMKLSLEAGEAIETSTASTIADGIAVRVPISSRLAELRRCCDSVVSVSEAQIFDAMRLIHRHLHLVVEPAGAVGVAAILAHPHRFAGRRIATVLCGGNISQELREQLHALD